ncbi:MAG: hypothetical protein COC15_01815 [Legionellales bacterium]|nr:MAG: hypothetical protein COC15_01815 [Legionellales bacterium]
MMVNENNIYAAALAEYRKTYGALPKYDGREIQDAADLYNAVVDYIQQQKTYFNEEKKKILQYFSNLNRSMRFDMKLDGTITMDGLKFDAAWDILYDKEGNTDLIKNLTTHKSSSYMRMMQPDYSDKKSMVLNAVADILQCKIDAYDRQYGAFNKVLRIGSVKPKNNKILAPSYQLGKDAIDVDKNNNKTYGNFKQVLKCNAAPKSKKLYSYNNDDIEMKYKNESSTTIVAMKSAQAISQTAWNYSIKRMREEFYNCTFKEVNNNEYIITSDKGQKVTVAKYDAGTKVSITASASAIANDSKKIIEIIVAEALRKSILLGINTKNNPIKITYPKGFAGNLKQQLENALNTAGLKFVDAAKNANRNRLGF